MVAVGFNPRLRVAKRIPHRSAIAWRLLTDEGKRARSAVIRVPAFHTGLPLLCPFRASIRQDAIRLTMP